MKLPKAKCAHGTDRNNPESGWDQDSRRNWNSSKLQLNIAVVYLIPRADPGNGDEGKWEGRQLI